MNKAEYIETLKQIPEEVRKQYGFNEPFDYSPYKCIHTDEYDYYPELDCCIIEEHPFVWTDNNSWVTPENPEILAGFKRILKKAKRPIMRFVEYNYDNTLTCYVCAKCEPHITRMKHHNQTTFILTDNIETYYNPNEIDLPNRPDLIKLARCLFYAQNHNVIGLIPDKNTPPEEWEPVIFTK